MLYNVYAESKSASDITYLKRRTTYGNHKEELLLRPRIY